MALDNLISIEFTPAELETINLKPQKYAKKDNKVQKRDNYPINKG